MIRADVLEKASSETPKTCSMAKVRGSLDDVQARLGNWKMLPRLKAMGSTGCLGSRQVSSTRSVRPL